MSTYEGVHDRAYFHAETARRDAAAAELETRATARARALRVEGDHLAGAPLEYSHLEGSHGAHVLEHLARHEPDHPTSDPAGGLAGELGEPWAGLGL